jgi:hypothetical protein
VFPASRYEQLGLKFVLYAAEVLFNKGLALIYHGRSEEGMKYLKRAQGVKAIPEHDVIDEAIQYQGDQFTVFSIVRFLRYLLRKMAIHTHTTFVAIARWSCLSTFCKQTKKCPSEELSRPGSGCFPYHVGFRLIVVLETCRC